MRVEILVFPGFDELNAFGPLEVLRNAARHDGELEVAVVSMDGVSVTGSHGLTVEVDHAISESSDLLVVPGGGWNDRSPAGVRAEIDKGTIPEALSAAHQRGTTVAGVCTGGMLLAAAGLTNGRPATTRQGAVEDLRASGGVLIQARVVEDGDIVTAG